LQPFTLFSFDISACGFVLVGLKNNNTTNTNQRSGMLTSSYVFVRCYSSPRSRLSSRVGSWSEVCRTPTWILAILFSRLL